MIQISIVIFCLYSFTSGHQHFLGMNPLNLQETNLNSLWPLTFPSFAGLSQNLEKFRPQNSCLQKATWLSHNTIQKLNQMQNHTFVIASHNPRRETRVKISLVARPLLTKVAQKLCRCEHWVFTSRKCVILERYFASKSFAVVREAFTNACPDNEVPTPTGDTFRFDIAEIGFGFSHWEKWLIRLFPSLVAQINFLAEKRIPELEHHQYKTIWPIEIF